MRKSLVAVLASIGAALLVPPALLREAAHIAEEAGHVYSLVIPLFGIGILTLDQLRYCRPHHDA